MKRSSPHREAGIQDYQDKKTQHEAGIVAATGDLRLGR
jgi:hypothetical protein